MKTETIPPNGGIVSSHPSERMESHEKLVPRLRGDDEGKKTS